MSLTSKGSSIVLSAILVVSFSSLLITQAIRQSRCTSDQGWREAWLEWASIAWRYFEPGVAVNIDTGLHYATGDWPIFTDWDLGIYIIAIIDSEKMGILVKEGDWGADYRIDKVMDFLQTRELTEDRLPYWGYDANTGEASSYHGSSTTNPSDSGKLLIALDKIRKHRPDLSSTIDEVVSRCDYPRLAQSTYFGLDDIYPYYVAEGFKAFGFDTPHLKDLDEVGGGEYVDVYDEAIPQAYVTSEPLIHAFLKLEPDPLYKEYAHRVYNAQRKRYEATGVLTAFSEGSYFGPYYYVYEWVATPNGETWVIRPAEAATPIVYTKVAFAFHAMYTTSYTEILVDYVSNLQTDEGFREGIAEDGKLLPLLSDKTNGMILSAARFATTAPTINDVWVSPSSGSFGALFTIGADVSDPSGVESVVARVQRPDETEVATITLTSGNGAYTGRWNSTDTPPGTYHIDIVAADRSGNLDKAENTATLRITDGTPGNIGTPILSPFKPTYESDVTVKISVSDPGGVDMVVLGYNDGTTWLNVTTTLTGEAYEATIPAEPYNTRIQYKIYVRDASGNWTVSETYSYTVADNTPPDLLDLAHTPVAPKCNESVTVTANVSEPLNASGVDMALLSYWNGYAWANSTMKHSNGFYRDTIPEIPYTVTVRYKIYASDIAGNWAASSVHSYAVGDVTSPQMTSPTWQPSELTSEDQVTINVDVKDEAGGVEKVILYYSKDTNTTWANAEMTPSSEDTYKASIGPFEAKTTIRFYVEAHDKAENKVISNTHSFTVKAAPTPYLYASGIIVAVAFTIAFASKRHWMKNRVKYGRVS